METMNLDTYNGYMRQNIKSNINIYMQKNLSKQNPAYNRIMYKLNF